MSQKLLKIVAMQESPAKTVRSRGRDFVVVPAVMVRSQVLNNNLGRTFLPADAFTPEWAASWNHAPVVVTDHPTKRGVAVSARDPEVLDKFGVGEVYRARVETVGGVAVLKAEVWLDKARAGEVEELATILNSLAKGKGVELSTGFPVIIENKAGAHGEEQYDYVIRPAGTDHLAIFAHKTGACSLTHGCGLGVNHAGGCDHTSNQRTAARTPKYSGSESVAWQKPTLADYVTGLKLGEVETIGDLTQTQRNRIASMTLLGDPQGMTFAELSYFPVVNPANGKLNENALKACLGGRLAQANLTAATKTSVEAKARALLEENFSAPAENSAPSWWGRLMRLIGRSGAVDAEQVANEMSDDERRQVLADAVRSTFGGPGRDVWLCDVYSDEGYLVFEYVSPSALEPGDYGTSARKLYRADYTLAEDGRIEFGEPKLVTKRVAYEPVAANSDDGPPSLPQPKEDEDMGMDRKKVIAQMAAAGPLSEAELSKLSDCQLSALQSAGGSPGAESPKGEQGPSAETVALTESVNKLAETVAALTTENQKAQQEIANLRDITTPVVAEQERERADLIATLKAGEGEEGFSEAELGDRSLKDLRKLAALAGRSTPEQVSYAGRGGPRAAANAEAEYADPKPYWNAEHLALHTAKPAGRN